MMPACKLQEVLGNRWMFLFVSLCCFQCNRGRYTEMQKEKKKKKKKKKKKAVYSFCSSMALYGLLLIAVSIDCAH